MSAIDLEAWAKRLGFDAFDDLGRLEDAIFGDLLARAKREAKPDAAPKDPVRVGQVDSRRPKCRSP